MCVYIYIVPSKCVTARSRKIFELDLSIASRVPPGHYLNMDSSLSPYGVWCGFLARADNAGYIFELPRNREERREMARAEEVC